ncbi:hypothetical protein [Asanoa iriomotensis]|uniref:Uncharacterized protein n=1 Tax=Asanoa iriomotensis TaxID=234613 RepID=A0ABQ4C5D2_9ACTN|nr:hypothetical protein [Asanoa iriomotensis]GIF57994.1 hypothetical protein Air01nite_40890 [Asanoa iriomotensis]
MFAVRVDWPDGTHEFFGPMATVETAWTQSGRVQRFWRQGPIRPLRVEPVTTSVNDFDLHRSRVGCKSPDCPVPPAAAGREAQR